MIGHHRHELPHGITLSCRCSGEPGRPVLLALHGFPEAAFVWDPLLAHFAQPAHGGYRCVAPHLRGYAGSSAPADVDAYRARHLVQDLLALIDAECGPRGAPVALLAHDWGGAVAWAFAAQHPARLARLLIVNSPHPGPFLRDLQTSPAQQAASAYMNALIRPDAEQRLAADDFAALWAFFERMGAATPPGTPGAPDGAGWLTPAVRARYRDVWRAGLTGPLNYYRASPLRPPQPHDPGAAGVTLPPEAITVRVPTRVLWALDDAALPPALLDGLGAWVPDLRVETVPRATHWVLHEQPARVIDFVARALSEESGAARRATADR